MFALKLLLGFNILRTMMRIVAICNYIVVVYSTTMSEAEIREVYEKTGYPGASRLYDILKNKGIKAVKKKAGKSK